MARFAAAGSIVVLAVVAWLAGSGRGAGAMSALDAGAMLAALPDLLLRAQVSVAQAYRRSPEMVVGLAVALMLPALSIACRVGRWAGRRGKDTDARPRLRPAGTTSPVARAWIEIADGERRRDVQVAGELMRIGRDDDNDVVLDGRKVEAFHALIRRTPEAEFMIIDVSGVPEGVAVNGRCLARSALKGGDRIEVGGVAVTFHRERRPGVASSALLH